MFTIYRFLLRCLAAGILLTTQEPSSGGDWSLALPRATFVFPRDHFAHFDYRTEWWYVTGTLAAADGRRFGYQFTIFRRGIRHPSQRNEPTLSRLIVNDLPLGHFTLTDEKTGDFFHRQLLSRGIFDKAGFDPVGGPRMAWIDGASLILNPDGSFSLTSIPAEDVRLDLRLTPTRPPLLHGDAGLSQKSAGVGNASYYYSLTRLDSSGTVNLHGRDIAVTGKSWLDREWATNQLSAAQVGWDWLALHLSDGSDLMLYRLRRSDGTTDTWSSGTWVSPLGSSRHLQAGDFTMTPVGTPWISPATQARYPIRWLIEVPSLSLSLKLSPWLENQELVLKPVTYWEGAVDATGNNASGAVSGEGYLELTGYTGPLTPLHGGK